MSSWSALISAIASLSLRARDTHDPNSYVTESSETEIAQHVELAPNRAWRKLTRRWRRSLRRDPKSARILNNLGVAYEQHGRFRLAGECYRRALDLAPENDYIRRNYELFERASVKATARKQKQHRRNASARLNEVTDCRSSSKMLRRVATSATRKRAPFLSFSLAWHLQLSR